jgi:hypothetical protein
MSAQAFKKYEKHHKKIRRLLLASICSAPFVAAFAQEGPYPSKPVKFITASIGSP